jgi:hypothetical protein
VPRASARDHASSLGHNGKVQRRGIFTCALTLVAAVSGCWMFGSLGDFPPPDSGVSDAGGDGRDTGGDTGRDTGRDTGPTPDTGVAHDGHGGCDGGTPTDGSTDAVVIVEAAFYVSTTGSDEDASPGTKAAPFATLGRAQLAMQGSSTIKTTYIRAGSYTLPTLDCGGGSSCGLNLTGTDDGETWSYYPPDGVDTADFTGGSTDAGTGLITAISVAAKNVTIDGLSIHNFLYAGIGSAGGTSALTVENCLIYNGFYWDGDQDPGGISCYGCDSTTISHNVVHDIAQFGIFMDNVNGDISNLLVTGNVIYNTCNGIASCGALVVDDSTSSATNIQLTNNYIHDGNVLASVGSGFGSALIAADCASNVTATGNVFSGRSGANTVLVHGGSNVHLFGNLTDLSTFQASIAAFQTSTGCDTMSGNEYEHNIIIGEGGGGGYPLLSGSPMNTPTITDNAYFSYDGGATIGTGKAPYEDSDPVTENPQISGWTYDIACGSPVFKSPVDFTALVGGWGPPGYVLLTTGTPPSCPLMP